MGRVSEPSRPRLAFGVFIDTFNVHTTAPRRSSLLSSTLARLLKEKTGDSLEAEHHYYGNV